VTANHDHPIAQPSIESRPDAALLVARPRTTAPRPRRTLRDEQLITRRSLVRTSLWAGLSVSGTGLLLGIVNYIWPRRVARAGTVITVPAAAVPEPGADPMYVQSGRFYLVNLRPGEGVPEMFSDFASPSAEGGILALSRKCPHLGCAVPWRPGFSAAETRGVEGWFRCPCHMSTYSKAGVRVFGPAPRSMDLFPVTALPDGAIRVDTTRSIPGSTENPQRALLT
jgi:cytochrome b6-f complex iron-sulfur subunit